MSIGSNRSRLLKISVIYSLSGKGVSVVTQLLALPLAVGALGLERFGMYAMLTAVFLWANAASAIVGSALALKIVAANANQDELLESRLFSTAFVFTVIVAAALGGAFQLALNFVDLSSFFGIASRSHASELHRAAIFMAIIVPFNIIFSLADSAQSGYQKQYITNILIIISNLFVIAGLVWVRSHPSISGMMLAVFLPPTAARLVNLAMLWYSHPHLLPKIRLSDRGLLWNLMAMGSGFFMMQIGSFAYQQFPIFYVGRHMGLDEAAYFAAMMQVLSISGSFLLIFTQPLLPAVGDANIRNDYEWIIRVYRLTVTRLMPYIALASATIALSGSFLLSQLLRHNVDISLTTRIAWGAFFLLVAWEHIGYIFLAGTGKLLAATTLYLAGAFTMLLALITLVDSFGLFGVFLSMCFGPAIFTSFIYPRLLLKTLESDARKVAS
jgi:O-antigen/teichoic acid export membrane protein